MCRRARIKLLYNIWEKDLSFSRGVRKAVDPFGAGWVLSQSIQ